MNTILDYIKNYNFTKHIEDSSEKVVEENLKKFSEEFWENPSVELKMLKSKYEISNSVSFSGILKKYPTVQYKELIKECWTESADINHLIEKYGIKLQRIEQLLYPIYFQDQNCVCPNCLDSDTFALVNNIKYSDYIIHCAKCNRLITDFFTKEEAESEKKKLEEKNNDFEMIVESIRTKLSDVKCPKCQEKMSLHIDKSKLKFKIDCSVCNNSYDNYTQLVKEYETWKQRATMMIKIKAKEEELINRFLDRKKKDDIIIKVEDSIFNEESIASIEYLVKKDFVDDNEAFTYLFKNIRFCNKLEKKLLVEICRLIKKEENNISEWSNSRDKKIVTKTRFIKPDEPIVSFLLDKTKIIIIRKTLRGLINNNVLYCCEKSNEIHVHTSIINNLSSIENLLKPQNIDNEIAHLIFGKQKYTCYHCGETGRPLKIAYLSADKDYSNLSSIIGVCDLCYYDVTENEVLIDAMIIGTEEYDNETSTSWKFLICNYPDFKNNDTASENNGELLEEYREEDLIKAYAATMDKFNREKKRGNFFAYARAILSNSDEGVNISKKIEKDFEIKKWMDKIQ
ncbi:hypothetical protein [Clostridium sp.]